jgi:peptidoglycan-associated lipoprotein
MKNESWIKLAALLVAAVFVFAVSCQKKTVAVEKGSVTTAQGDGYNSATADYSDMAEENMDTPAATRAGNSAKMNAYVMQEDIFFEFDKFTLTPVAKETLVKNAKWLRMNRDVIITIEGHCDERGTNAYNLALGDRRSETVKTFLVDLGIDRSRLATISYGEEKPLVPGQGEDAWAQNRRAHFLIK